MIGRLKPIPGYGDRYSITNDGQIHTRWTNGFLKHNTDKNGYKTVVLNKNLKPKTLKVHRLVMLTFKGPSKLQVNHKNGIKSDNRLSNLEYCTASQNIQHSFDTGLKIGPRGEKQSTAKLDTNTVLLIRWCRKEAGMTYSAIGKIYNVETQNVGQICRGKRWKHLLNNG